MATMESAEAEKTNAVQAAEKVATVKSVVETVASEKAHRGDTEDDRFVASRTECFVKCIRPRGSVGVAWQARAEEEKLK